MKCGLNSLFYEKLAVVAWSKPSLTFENSYASSNVSKFVHPGKHCCGNIWGWLCHFEYFPVNVCTLGNILAKHSRITVPSNVFQFAHEILRRVTFSIMSYISQALADTKLTICITDKLLKKNPGKKPFKIILYIFVLHAEIIRKPKFCTLCNISQPNSTILLISLCSFYCGDWFPFLCLIKL